MIDPHSIERLIHEKVDGLLDPETEHQLDRWMQTHPADAEALQKTLRTRQIVGLLQYDDPGDDFRDQFLDEFHNRLLQSEFRQAAKRSVAQGETAWFHIRHWLVSPLSAGVAAAAVVMLTLFAYHQGNLAAERRLAATTSTSVPMQQQALPSGGGPTPTQAAQPPELDPNSPALDQMVLDAYDPANNADDLYPARRLQPPAMNVDYSF